MIFCRVLRGITFVFHQFILLEERHFVFCANKHKEAGYISVLINGNYIDGKYNEKYPSFLQNEEVSVTRLN